MSRRRHRLTTFTLAALIAVAPTLTGCNPVSFLLNNVNYTLFVPLGLNGSAGLLNPLGFVTLIFANLTNLLGLGYISPNAGAVNPGGGSGGTPPPIFGS